MTLDLGQIKFGNIDKKSTGLLYTRWKIWNGREFWHEKI